MIGVATTRSVCIQTACSSAALVPGLATPDWHGEAAPAAAAPPSPSPAAPASGCRTPAQRTGGAHWSLGFQTLTLCYIKHAFPKPGHTGARQRLHTPSRLKRSLLKQGTAPPGARSAATEHTGTVSAQRAGLRTRGRACAGGASRLSPVPIEVTSTKRFTPRRAASSTRFMLPCAPRRRRRAPGCVPGAVHPQACIGG